MTIDIRDVGPVTAVSIPVPEDGGIVVLRGRNDCGKTQALAAVNRLLGSKDQLEQRDGSAGTGEISWDTASIRVGKSTRKRGELEVLSIAGALSIEDLVEPRQKSPEVADRVRTKALCRLTGVEAREDLFYDVFGGKEGLEAIMSASATDTDDVVEMQRRIKQDAEKQARKEEDLAAKREGEARALATFGEGLDLDAEHRSDVLQEAVEASLRELELLRANRRNALDAQQRVADARNAREEAILTYHGPSADEARTSWKEALAASVECLKALEAAQRAYDQAVATKNQAAERHEMAVQHEKSMARWQEAIAESADIVNPTQESIDRAVVEYDQAKRALEVGVKIREALRQRARYDEVRREAKQHRDAAERLRDAGRMTERILADVVEADGLTLRDGRWITDHPERGEVFFHDRSKGVKASMGIQLVVNRLRELGDAQAVVPFPQELWEGLDAENRRDLAETCKRLGVVVITAEADRDGEPGDLRAESYK